VLAGRNFSAEEMTPNGPSVVLLAEDFWRRQFGGARDVIGKTILAKLAGRWVAGHCETVAR
jgi:hypothetical protein